jgi:hypothetical protein
LASRLQYRGVSGLYWFYLALTTASVAMALVLLVVGAVETNGTAPLITGIVTTPFVLPVWLALASVVLRPVVMDDEALRLPKTFGTRRIPLANIAGIGLLYQRTPQSRRPEGWFLEAWTKDGKRIQVGGFLVLTLRQPASPNGKRPVITTGRDPTLPLPHEDVDDLARTRPGRIATEMYEWVLARQGPAGSLATEALQKSATYEPSAPTQVWAWWSPDGTMERLCKPT